MDDEKKEDLWTEAKTLEQWMRDMLSRGEGAKVLPLLKALPESLRSSYRKVWLEVMRRQK